ncbi:MAG: hypothetical protein WC998_02105 [Candidatus Paceibacterota bacterium]
MEVRNISLVALNDNFNIKGNFYLGFGGIEGAMYYTYSYRQGRELIQKSIMKTEDVYLYDDRTDGKGVIYYYESYHIKDLSQWPLNLIFNGVGERDFEKKWIEINVPPNSIVQGMVLDSK